jgi:hypothetical protein
LASGFQVSPIGVFLQNSDALNFEALRKLGVHTHGSLQEYRGEHRDKDFLIPDLLQARSRNVFIGDSGLGKTPFTLDMAIRIAAGLPWLGHKAGKPEKVLYCDGESGMGLFDDTLSRLVRNAGLSQTPTNLVLWNPFWRRSEHNPASTYRPV